MPKNILIFFILIAFSQHLFCQDIDVLHYRYRLEVTDRNDTLTGMAVVTFVLQSERHLATLDLAGINQNGKGMMVKYVGAGTYELKFTHERDKLLIGLPKNKMGDTLKIWIVYNGIPADGLIISKNKYGDRTFFADNWPNRAHQWVPCKDVPADKASVEFTVTAPAHYNVISNGVLIEEKELGYGKKETHWKEDNPIPTKIMVIGIARFATKTFKDSPKDIPVSAWVYPQDSTKGFYDYALAVPILKFFTEYIGPYPYQKLANVQSKTIFGGMENASAIFYAENTVTGNRSSEELMAHEIAHQWFGNTASEKIFAHLWLSEGFASYLTDIYVEHKYGKDSMIRKMQKERMQVIQFAARSPNAVVDTTSILMDLLNANSYQKGAWVLHMLRSEVGDSTFHQIIKTYYGLYKGSNADTRDLQAVAENVSGKNLKLFFDQWLYTPGIPVLMVQQQLSANEVQIKITQQRGLFHFPIEIGLVKEGGEMQIEKIEVTEKETVYKTKISGVKKVLIDPNGKLLFAQMPGK
ncbi:MAG: M1 family metallopeptidase [Chitinophagaceae bacterium]